MLAHIGDIADFKNAGKLAAYFGIVPKVSNSNETNNSGRITKRGNKLARKTLVQCTLIAKRYSPYFHSFYEILKQGAVQEKPSSQRQENCSTLSSILSKTVGYSTILQPFPKFNLAINHRRVHESLNNLTPEEVYLEKGQTILNKLDKIKKKTMEIRKRKYYKNN